MKKKGSALVMVLTIATALLILGTAISTAVVNTNKFNDKYSDNIDLELAAKSGLNIAREELIFKINEAGNDSSKLPLGIKGEIEYGEIEVTKKIERNPEQYDSSAKKYEYTIRSEAKYKGIIKEEEQVLIVNISDSNEENDEIFTDIIMDKFINVTNNIDIQWLNDSKYFKENFSYGNTLFHDGISETTNQNNILNNITLEMNESNINEYIKSLNINKQIKYNEVSSNNQEIVIDASDINDGTFSLENISDSRVIVKGDVILNKETNINLNNSKIKIEGSLISHQSVKKINLNNSIIEISKDIEANGIDIIEVKNKSDIIIHGTLNSKNPIDIRIKDNSNIRVGGVLKANNIKNIELEDNCSIVIEDNLESGQNINIKAIKNSFISIIGKIDSPGLDIYLDNSKFNIRGSLISGNELKAKLTNNSTINIEGEVTAPGMTFAVVNSEMLVQSDIESGNPININLENSSIILNKRINSANNININTLNSVLVTRGQASVCAGNVIDIQSQNSGIFINGELKANEYKMMLDNSAAICIGDMTITYRPTFINIKDSFQLVIGSFKTNQLAITNNSSSIIPNSSTVINAINYFLRRIK